MDVTQAIVGIIGDGQLALMLAESLQKFDIKFRCLSVAKNSPMMREFPKHTTLDYKSFQSECTVFTLENEFQTTEELEKLLLDKTQYLFPDLPSYQHFSDKISQRQLFSSLNIPSPKWMALTLESQIPQVRANFSYPFVLKASQGGYDGKGVCIVKNDEEFASGLKNFGFHLGKPQLIEEMVAIKKEIAQGFVRNIEGQFTLLPLVDTIQENGVCNFVYYPADVSENVGTQVKDCLKKLINFGLNGIFNFEFFVNQNDEVFINEGAPRPHNSQHLTIDASDYSQFDLLALYLGRPTQAPLQTQTHSSGMINILGKSSGPGYTLTLPQISGVEVHPKTYGKELCSPRRKMGHVNIVDPSGKEDLRRIAEKIFKEYYI